MGLLFGGAELWLLTIAVRSIAGEKIRVLPMLLQFLCPVAALLLCALLARTQLMICAVCIIVVLLGGSAAVVLFKRNK